jgi:hypothetical protein
MGGSAILWLSAVRHSLLRGPAGANMDGLVAGLISAGFGVEAIKPGTDYRVSGPEDRLVGASLQINGGFDEISMDFERPADGVVAISTAVAPLRPHRRTVHLQGEGVAVTFVARAVDLGLIVTSAGIWRWAVTGPSHLLMQFLAAHVHEATIDETMAVYGLTPADVAAEDADAVPPTINVVLPDRRTTTTSVERGADGLISKIVQLETDVIEP